MNAGAFRLLLAIVVVLHHSLGFFGYGTAAVYLFFVLSGYWTARMWDQKYSKYRHGLMVFYLSRWMRIVPVLITTLLLAWISAASFPKSLSPEFHNALQSFEWWLHQLFLVTITIPGIGLGPTWSLAVEMQFYLLLPLLLLLWLPAKINRVPFYVVFAFTGMAFLWFGASPMSGNVFIFLSFFWLGINRWRNPNFLRKKFWLIGGAALFLTSVSVIYSVPEWRNMLTNYSSDRTSQATAIHGVLFYILAIFLVPVALDSVGNGGSALDRWFGNLSYPLYLFHMIPIGLCYSYRKDLPLPEVVTLGISWLLSVIGSILILQLVDRPFENLRASVIKKFGSSRR